MIARLAAPIVALALVLAPPPAQARPDAAVALTGAREDLDAARAAFDIPGLAVAVVADGKLVMAQGFGRQGLDDAEPVDADTRFAIGSCSKAFTALGVGLLEAEGKLGFADPVHTHDPDLRLPSASALKQITIAQLLSHRAGLARHDFLWHAYPGLSRASFAAAQGHLAMQSAPGERFGYTNSAYILAGRLIELESGLSWEAFTAQRILAPLSMTRTNFSSAGLAADANAARATKRADGVSRTVAWRDGRLLGPAGSINSTAHDMARWMLMLLDRGAIDGVTIASPRTIDRLWTPAPAPTARARQRAAETEGGYAMGWRVDAWKRMRRVSHTGAIDGFRARVTLFPDQRVGIAVMANMAPGQITDFATRALAERLFGLPRETDLAALAGSRRADEIAHLARPPELPRGRVARLNAKDPAIAPSRPLETFEGVYRHPAYGEIAIERTADGAALRIRFGALEGRLDHWRGDSFITFSDRPDDTLDEGEIVFRTDASGAATGLTAMIDNDIAPIRFEWTGPIIRAAAEPAEAALTGAPPPPPPVRGMGFGALGLLALFAGAVVWRTVAARRA